MPDGYEVQEGQQGGYYYETDGGGQDSGGDDSGDSGLSPRDSVPDDLDADPDRRIGHTLAGIGTWFESVDSPEDLSSEGKIQIEEWADDIESWYEPEDILQYVEENYGEDDIERQFAEWWWVEGGFDSA